ncbi:MAG: hypothetical protein ACTSYV_03645 [Candidatus Heimdallarchaeaceae archaeon]
MQESTLNNLNEIYSCFGSISFYDDSICYHEGKGFLFTFVGCDKFSNTRNDLFLGRYDGIFTKVSRLSSTKDYTEKNANCEVGSECLHVIWSSSYEGNSSELLKRSNQIFYQRFLLEEIDQLFSIKLRTFINNVLNIKPVHTSILDVQVIVIVTKSNKGKYLQ